jgi:hypothetical protein
VSRLHHARRLRHDIPLSSMASSRAGSRRLGLGLPCLGADAGRVLDGDPEMGSRASAGEASQWRM